MKIKRMLRFLKISAQQAELSLREAGEDAGGKGYI